MRQEDLAQRAGYATITIRKIESGEMTPSRELAEQLAECLEVPAADRAAFLAFARGVEGRPRLNNLPSPPTSLVGRDADTAQVCELLRWPGTRLATVVGPPGVGKTRLAIRVAHEMDPAFASGVCFVALAPVSVDGGVAPAIAEALGVQGDMQLAVTARLMRYLRDKRLLLVLDNCEHVLEGVRELAAELLVSAPEVKVLATSRAALRLSAEQVFELAPLAVPDLQHLPPPAALTDYAAVELFVQRAGAAKLGFHLTPANAPAVAEICQRVDGLPLAIELAAVRARMFTPETLLAHLDHHLGALLRVLSAGAHDLPARQQTLRSAIDWSYHLLTAEEQALFRRLGVFVGGGTLEAIQAVCGDERLEPAITRSATSDSLVSSLESLIDHSLVQRMEGLDGTGRYTMLETIREYALERLAECGEDDLVRRRHVRYYAQAVIAAQDHGIWRRVGEQVLKWAVSERHNLRAALIGSRDDEDPCRHERIALMLIWLTHVGKWYLGMPDDLHDMEAALVRSLERHPDSAPAHRAHVLRGLSLLAIHHGDREREQRLLTESLALEQATGNLGGEFEATHLLGWCAYSLGDVPGAEGWFARELELGQQLDSPNIVLDGLCLLGRLALERRDTDRAEDLLERARALAHAQGIKTAIGGCEAVVLQFLGRLAHERAEYARAWELGQRSLALYMESGEGLRCCIEHLYLGQAGLAQQRLDQARPHLKACIHWAREYSFDRILVIALAHLARVALQGGEVARYARLMGAQDGKLPARGRMWDQLMILDVEQLWAIMAEAQSHLGDPNFSTAWAEGRAMTWDQAVAYALAEDQNVWTVIPNAGPATPPSGPSHLDRAPS